ERVRHILGRVRTGRPGTADHGSRDRRCAQQLPPPGARRPLRDQGTRAPGVLVESGAAAGVEHDGLDRRRVRALLRRCLRGPQPSPARRLRSWARLTPWGRGSRGHEVRHRALGPAPAGGLASRPLPGARRAGPARASRGVHLGLGEPALSLRPVHLLPADPDARLREVRISMRPLQQPRPPVWLAANADAGVRRAARLGDTWLMNPHATLPTLERQLALFRRTRAELRRPAATETPLIKECYVAPESSTALAEAAAFLDAKYRAYRRWEQDKALPAGESFDASFAELARDRFLIGDPARVADEIARYRERLGVTTLIFRLQWPGMGQEQVLRSIRLLGTKVLPRLS